MTISTDSYLDLLTVRFASNLFGCALVFVLLCVFTLYMYRRIKKPDSTSRDQNETTVQEGIDVTDGSGEERTEENVESDDIEKDVSLSKALREKGLDTTYWLEIFDKQFKITDIVQLKHLGKAHLQQLEQHTQYSWETEALRKVIKEHGDKTDMGSGRMAYDIVTKASGGSILRGVLWTKDLTDFLTPRKVLVSVPPDIELLSPEEAASTCDIGSESRHTSKSLERYVKRSAIKLGSKGCLDAVGGILAGIGFQWNKGKSEAKFKADCREEIAFSYTKYRFIPMRCFQLQNNTLCISDEAMSELKTIERCIEEDSKQKLGEACQIFLEKFGSHVNMGIFHLGGIYSCTASFCKKSDLSENTIQSMLVQALESCMKLGANNCNAAFDGSMMTEKHSASGMSRGNQQADIKVTKVVDGGQSEAATLQEWEATLKDDNKKWQVIDCGNLTDENFKAIWELIEERQGLFQKPTELRNALQEHFNRKTYKHIEQCKSNIKRVTANHESNDDGNTYYKDLQELFSEVRSLRIYTKGGENEWEKLLQEKAKIIPFLLKPKKKLRIDDEESVLAIIEALVSDVNFRAKDSILQMIADKRQPRNERRASRIKIIIKNKTTKELEYQPDQSRKTKKSKWVSPETLRSIPAGGESLLLLTSNKDVKDFSWSIEARLVYKVVEGLYFHISVASSDRGPTRMSIDINADKDEKKKRSSPPSDVTGDIDKTVKGYSVQASIKLETLPTQMSYVYPCAEISIKRVPSMTVCELM